MYISNGDEIKIDANAISPSTSGGFITTYNKYGRKKTGD